MLSYKIGTSEYGFNCLQVSYEGSGIIEINLTDFYKDENFLSTLYEHVDMYVKCLSPDTQKEIYSIFHDTFLKEASISYGDPAVIREIELKIKRLCELLDYQRWNTWFRQFQDQIPIPETVNSTFEYDPDTGTTKEKTYIHSEYIDLIALITFIRILSPVYVEFFNYSKERSNHPYYLLFRLFVDSEINDCVVIEKLRAYIEANLQTLVGTNKNEHLIVSAGLSDDDALDYLIAEVIFNKLLTIDFFRKKCNIVSFIFQTVKYKGSFSGSESDAIRTKSSRGDSDREDFSYFEDHRKTTDVAVGTVVEIQDSLNDEFMLARDLGYVDFDFEQYHKELQNVSLLLRQPPDPCQVYLLGWFLSKAVNPRALFHIEERKIAELFLFAKVALIKTSHSFIGLFLGSVKAADAKHINIIIRNTLNKTLVKNLRRHYGFAMGTDESDNKPSLIERTITELSKEISNSIWIPVGDISDTKGLITQEGYLEIPANINDVVCSFVDFVLDTKQAQFPE